MIISIKSVLHVPEETYFIEGNSMHGTEKKVYHISFGTHEICVSCSSPCFRRNRSLCKHSFAINDSGYRSFEDLTSLYRNHPLHKYLFQQEKWLLIVICYGNLSSAVLVVNKFSYNLFLFALFQINVRFRLQIQARGVK